MYNFLLVQPPPTEIDCSSLLNINGKAYDVSLSQGQGNFAWARSKCQTTGGDLPTFRTQKEFKIMFYAYGKYMQSSSA